MSNNYQGYLLKFGGAVMPNSYFVDFSSTPNQRMDTSAERNNLGDLQRTTLPNHKTSIKFSTHILHLNEKINLQSIINSAITNSVERKCSVTYWNDETNSYSSGYFYIPDVQYTIMNATSDKDILYNPITIELIEY